MIKDIVYNSISQGLQFGSRWLLNLMLIYILDVKLFAIFTFVYSMSNILLSIIPFGSSVYLISDVKKGSSSFNELVYSVGISSFIFISVIIVYFILYPFLYETKGWEFLIYGIFLSFILSLNLITFSYLKGKGFFLHEMKSYLGFSIMMLFFIGFNYFILDESLSVHFLFLFLIFINFTVLFHAFFQYGIYRDFKKYSCSSFNLIEVKVNFSKRLYFGLQEIVTAIYTQGGMILLFYILDEKMYANYRSFFIIIAPVFMLSVAISQVILQQLRIRNHKIDFFRKVQKYTFFLALVFSILIFSMREYIYEFIKLELTIESDTALLMIIGLIIFRFIFSNYEMLLIIYDLQRKRFVLQSYAAVISIISIFLLVPRYGFIGAIATNLLSYTVVMFGLMWITERKLIYTKER